MHCVKVPNRVDLTKLLNDKKSYITKILTQINKLEGDSASVTLKKRK
jgi:hypothetical protein